NRRRGCGACGTSRQPAKPSAARQAGERRLPRKRSRSGSGSAEAGCHSSSSSDLVTKSSRSSESGEYSSKSSINFSRIEPSRPSAISTMSCRCFSVISVRSATVSTNWLTLCLSVLNTSTSTSMTASVRHSSPLSSRCFLRAFAASQKFFVSSGGSFFRDVFLMISAMSTASEMSIRNGAIFGTEYSSRPSGVIVGRRPCFAIARFTVLMSRENIVASVDTVPPMRISSLRPTSPLDPLIDIVQSLPNQFVQPIEGEAMNHVDVVPHRLRYGPFILPVVRVGGVAHAEDSRALGGSAHEVFLKSADQRRRHLATGRSQVFLTNLASPFTQSSFPLTKPASSPTLFDGYAV